MQHMAGDNFPTHAHRGGWITEPGARDSVAAASAPLVSEPLTARVWRKRLSSAVN